MKRIGLALDIDETLSWTLGWWVEKMLKLFGNPENLSVTGLIEKYRYTQNVPYWQTPEINAWMEEQRRSSDVQEKLPLIEGAEIYVKKIDKYIPIVAYITIRPKSAIIGTKKWLKKYGFPDAQIYHRPDDIEFIGGNKWKAEILPELWPNVIGIVDDNPDIVNLLPESYPGKIFIYNYESEVKPKDKVYYCKDWQEVFTKIKTAIKK